MSQSFFTKRCPHCKNDERGSCGGLGLIGQRVTLCGTCHKPYEVLPNSYGWKSISMHDDEEPRKASRPQTQPRHPRKRIVPELQAEADQLVKEYCRKHNPTEAEQAEDQRQAAAGQVAEQLKNPDVEVLVRNRKTGVTEPLRA